MFWRDDEEETGTDLKAELLEAIAAYGECQAAISRRGTDAHVGQVQRADAAWERILKLVERATGEKG